jgi:hypothetical protein
MICLSYYLLSFLFNKSGEQVLPGSVGSGGGGGERGVWGKGVRWPKELTHIKM